MDFKRIAWLAQKAETIKGEIASREQSICELKDGLQGIEMEIRGLCGPGPASIGPVLVERADVPEVEDTMARLPENFLRGEVGRKLHARPDEPLPGAETRRPALGGGQCWFCSCSGDLVTRQVGTGVEQWVYLECADAHACQFRAGRGPETLPVESETVHFEPQPHDTQTDSLVYAAAALDAMGPLAERKCIQCGRSDSHACLGPAGPCWWHTTISPLCSECHRLNTTTFARESKPAPQTLGVESKPLPNWIDNSEVDVAGWVPEPEPATPVTGISPGKQDVCTVVVKSDVLEMLQPEPKTVLDIANVHDNTIGTKFPFDPKAQPSEPKQHDWTCSKCHGVTKRTTPQHPGLATTAWKCASCKESLAGEKITRSDEGATPRGFARELVMGEMARLAKLGQHEVTAATLISVQQKHGVWFDTARTQIASWVDRGLLVRVAKGVFSLPGAPAAKTKREPETEEQ